MSSTEPSSSANITDATGSGTLLVDANFAEKNGTLHKDNIGDWVAELKSLNRKRIDECDEYSELYLTRETVEYVFTLCIRLRMPIEVRFIAAAIFDKFMRIHTQQMITFLSGLDMDPRRKKEEWECVETNMSRQLTLRICSAIQIASKDVSYHDSLSSTQICKCLRTVGTPYTKSVVLKSEIRMLKAIDFRIPITPVVYSESLLRLFHMYKRPDLHVNSVWSYMCILMDVVLMQREVIYNRLISELIQDDSCITITDKNRMKADWMLLACSLVCAGCCCHYGFDVGDPVSTELEDISETPAIDIRELAIVIIEVAREGGEVKREEMDQREECTPPPIKRKARGAASAAAVNSRDGSIPFAFPIRAPIRGK